MPSTMDNNTPTLPTTTTDSKKKKYTRAIKKNTMAAKKAARPKRKRGRPKKRVNISNKYPFMTKEQRAAAIAEEEALAKTKTDTPLILHAPKKKVVPRKKKAPPTEPPRRSKREKRIVTHMNIAPPVVDERRSISAQKGARTRETNLIKLQNKLKVQQQIITKLEAKVNEIESMKSIVI